MEETRIKEIFSLFGQSKILVIGDSMVDKYIHGSVERISPEAPIPIVLKKKEEFRPGGAANVALNLAMLGAKVMLMTSIAEDEDGKKILDILHNHGVQVVMANLSHTIVKTRIVAHNQQVVRVDDEMDKSTYAFDLKEANCNFIKNMIEHHSAVILSDYNKGVLTQDLVNLISRHCKDNKKFIAMDPKPSNKIQFGEFDLITPNRKEANELVGQHNLELDKLIPLLYVKYKTKILAVTLSEDGVAMSENGQTAKLFPAAAREVSDPCGAGDTHLSLLVLTLSNNIPMNEAAFLANVASGIVVGKHGTATTNQQEILSWVGKSN